MKNSLVVYRKGNVKEMKLEWDYYNPIYLNLSKRNLSDIQGMRFGTIIVCRCVSDNDKTALEKYLTKEGVIYEQNNS